MWSRSVAAASENERHASVWALVHSKGSVPRELNVVDIDVFTATGINDPDLSGPTFVVSDIPHHAIQLFATRASGSQNRVRVYNKLRIGLKVVATTSN